MTDKPTEQQIVTSATSLNGGDVLLGDPKAALLLFARGKDQNLSPLNSHARPQLEESLYIAQLSSPPDNNRPIGEADLNFAVFYGADSDPANNQKAHNYVNDALKIAKQNNDLDMEDRALREEKELVEKANPHPLRANGEKTEAEKLQDQIDHITKYQNALKDYSEASNGRGTDTKVAQTLAEVATASAEMNENEQADRAFQRALKLMDNEPEKDDAATLAILQSYSQFLHQTNRLYTMVDDRIKALGGTVGDVQQQPASATAQGAMPQELHGIKPAQGGVEKTRSEAPPIETAPSNDPPPPVSPDIAPFSTGAPPASSDPVTDPIIGVDDAVVLNEAGTETETAKFQKALKKSKEEPLPGDADINLTRDLAIAREVFGMNSDQAVQAAEHLGDFYKSKGPDFYSQACSYYAEALPILDKADHADNGQLGKLLQSYAQVLHDRDPQSADQMSARGSSLEKQNKNVQKLIADLQNDNFEVLPSDMSGMAQNYAEQGDQAKAESLFREAISLHEKDQHGVSDDNVYLNYSLYLNQQNRPEEAKRYADLYATDISKLAKLTAAPTEDH
jgi:tetratricopeptide (TPR) repeat protein